MGLIERIADYVSATETFLAVLATVSPENIDRHIVGGWSARQVIHHVADSETHSYLRLRRLLAEPVGGLIQGYDEAAWAQCDALGYRDMAVEHSIAVFTAVRASSLDVLGRLHASDLERHGNHSSSGHYTIDDWLNIYTRHPVDHAAQLTEAINAPF